MDINPRGYVGGARWFWRASTVACRRLVIGTTGHGSELRARPLEPRSSLRALRALRALREPGPGPPAHRREDTHAPPTQRFVPDPSVFALPSLVLESPRLLLASPCSITTASSCFGNLERPSSSLLPATRDRWFLEGASSALPPFRPVSSSRIIGL
ncbi:hypothetical protein KM043_008919 [Ampulex compressa]|nr:hypothetical protein KM043_008919 [Ampulex compressa]